jgi:UDP-N-acetylbacillosamine N-acetyltransferase
LKILAVIGAGGHARSALNLLKKYSSEYEIRVYDDCYVPDNNEYINSALLSGKVDDIPVESPIFLAIGDNKKREQYFTIFRDRIITANLLHERAYAEDYIQMGIANQIFAGAYLNSCVEIGDNNIINSSAVLEHETKIGSHNHVSVG